ncbi:hypothetical protein [Neobacillus sp. D3-1R]|uniref:hypothetical protein n=1 Tax=Neobacillus sp. D3-1R TaxID=3445778 RepID=UPI003FA0EFCF
MRSKKAILSIITALSTTVIRTVMGIWFAKLFLETYGSSINGLDATITQLLSYLLLVDGGMGASIIFSLYKPLANKDWKAVSEILSAARKIFRWIALIIFILSILLGFLIPYFIHDNTIPSTTMFWIMALAGLNVSLDYLGDSLYRLLLMADQRSYIINLIAGILHVLIPLVSIIFIKHGASVIVIKMIIPIFTILRIIMVLSFVKRKYTMLDFNVSPNWAAVKKTKDVLVHKISGLVVYNTDIVVISVFLGLKESSIYAVYNMVFTMLKKFITPIFRTVEHTFGNMMVGELDDNFQKTYSSYEIMVLMMITITMTVSYIMVLPFIKLYTSRLGDPSYISTTYAMLFVLINILDYTRMAPGNLISATGQYKETKLYSMIEAAINITVTLILVKILGITGVLIGTICSFAYRTTQIVHYTYKKILNQPLRRFVYRFIWNSLIGIILSLSFHALPFKIDNFIEWLLISILVSLSVFSIVLVLNMPFEKENINYIFNRIKPVFLKFVTKGKFE